jgi:hypothetical protein
VTGSDPPAAVEAAGEAAASTAGLAGSVDGGATEGVEVVDVGSTARVVVVVVVDAGGSGSMGAAAVSTHDPEW